MNISDLPFWFWNNLAWAICAGVLYLKVKSLEKEKSGLKKNNQKIAGDLFKANQAKKETKKKKSILERVFG